MKNKIIKLALIGFVVNAVCCHIVAYLASGRTGFMNPEFVAKMGGPAGAFIVQTLLAGLVGALNFATTTFYDIEHWPLAKATVLHWLVVACSYVPLAFYLGWITEVRELLIIEAIMLVGYFIIWLIMCAIYRAQVRELNELQQKYLKDSQEQE